jgi:hypothetical protein
METLQLLASICKGDGCIKPEEDFVSCWICLHRGGIKTTLNLKIYNVISHGAAKQPKPSWYTTSWVVR